MWLDPRRYEIIDQQMADALRNKSPDERLAMAEGIWRMARNLIRDKLRQDHPQWTEDQIAQETARRMSGGAI